ncbi:MAG: hypothetical protein JWO36_2537 [Myxococcales bacterium]|nr:hypothetical protein [Myxococcales bacterium]
MKPREPDPDPIVSHERKTMELCGDERGGVRCMLPRGHADMHESHHAERFVSWRSRGK